MPKLKENTLLTKPGTLDLVSLSAGEDVPDWAVGLIGDHLVEDEKPKRATTSRAKATEPKTAD
jgi:hypothetical protein